MSKAKNDTDGLVTTADIPSRKTPEPKTVEVPVTNDEPAYGRLNGDRN